MRNMLWSLGNVSHIVALRSMVACTNPVGGFFVSSILDEDQFFSYKVPLEVFKENQSGMGLYGAVGHSTY